jgi:aspartate aminotransferase
MTGWRLGYLVTTKDMIEKLSKVAVNIWSCPVSFAQKAAIAALKGDMTPVYNMVETFRRRRDVMIRKLREIKGFEVWSSKGAFYVYPRIKNILDKTGLTTEEFVNKLLYSKHVVVLPGTAFPDKAGDGFLRFSFAVDEEKIRIGIDKIKEFVEDLEL